MAQLEIRDRQNTNSVVALRDATLTFGVDGEGHVVWSRDRMAEELGEIRPENGSYVLEHDGIREVLIDGSPIDIGGVAIVFRSDIANAASVRAAALNELGDVLWTLEHTEDLFDRVLDSVVRVLHVENIAIALLDDDEELQITAHHGDAPKPNGTITLAVLESGAAVLTAEAEVDERNPDQLEIRVRSVLCAPLRMRGRALGVLMADNRGRSASFNNDELDFVSALAHLTSFALDNISRTEELEEENTLLRRRLGIGGAMVLASAAMEEIYRKIDKVSGFDATVLILGESGVGKEVAAAQIHQKSGRRDGPFVAINCAAIPDTLLEAELFGFAPHSGISGADPKGRPGRFEQAHGGTIFLDEIGELRPDVQAKLLRVLQDKKIDRLGDTRPREADVRIVVATNRDLEGLVEKGLFREDLYYRLNVVTIELPPLRDRRDDILALAEFFVRTYPAGDELQKAKLSRAASRVLEAYHWPGNVRELKNCIEQALILGDSKTIRAKDLPERIRKAAREGRTTSGNLPPLSEIEKEHIARVLAATGWNKAKSSRILGISKPTLYEKIRLFELVQPEK